MDDEEYVIRPTKVWGDAYKTKNINRIRRLTKKQRLLCNGMFDHKSIHSYKPKSQRGPAREEQTFLVSYNYLPLRFPETDMIAEVESCGLTYYRSECVFRGLEAYRIIVMDSEVPLETILEMEDQFDRVK